jgi:Mu-like prophage major head subunit gpT
MAIAIKTKKNGGGATVERQAEIEEKQFSLSDLREMFSGGVGIVKPSRGEHYNGALPKNAERLAKLSGFAIEKYRERFEREYGMDPQDVWDQQDEWGFSLLQIKESIDSQVLREAVAETMFGNLVRYGVSKALLDNYALVETIYKDIAFINPSKGFEEWYGPVFRGDIPVGVNPGQPLPEGRLMGTQTTIRNKRYGRALTIERELIEDDQTGQIMRRAQSYGDSMAYAEEAACIIALFAASATAPAQNVAGQAANTTAAALGQIPLENGWTALALAVDGLGNLMLAKPNAMVVGVQDEITAKKLLQAAFQPSFPTGTAGTIGYFQTPNILKDMFTIYATAFVSKARATISGQGFPWVIMEKGKSLVFQPRTPLTVEQEAPNAGVSLFQYQYRWAVQRRFGVGVPEPRFCFWGN